MQGPVSKEPHKVFPAQSHDEPFLDPRLTEWTTFQLRQVTLRAQAQVANALSPLRLRPAHLSILTVLHSQSLSQAALGTRLQTDRTTMVDLIDELEDLALVKRQRSAYDRRAYQIALTSLGSETLVQVQGVIRAVEDDFFAPLTVEERTSLRSMLTRLLHRPAVTL